MEKKTASQNRPKTPVTVGPVDVLRLPAITGHGVIKTLCSDDNYEVKFLVTSADVPRPKTTLKKWTSARTNRPPTVKCGACGRWGHNVRTCPQEES